ncbi:hypothetical protein D3C84_508060 [compost metagenome]
MFKIVKQPLALKQSLYKIEVTFAILSNETALLECFAQAKLKFRQSTKITKNVDEHVLYRLVLKNP